jgi:diguanylate cyclase (GGDEF)-like protein
MMSYVHNNANQAWTGEPAWPLLGRLRRRVAALWELRNSPRLRASYRDALRVLPESLAVMLCLALVWASLLVPLHQQRTDAVNAAIESTGNLVRAFDENSDRIVSGIDQILLSARAAYRENPATFNLVDWVKTRAKADKFAFFIGRIGPDGMSGETTLVPPPSKPINLSDREHFRVHLDPTKDIFFISKPIVGRATKRPALQFTRKMLNPDGSFAGVIQVSLNTTELSKFYDELEIGNGFVELVSSDGTILARGPLDTNKIGHITRNQALLHAIGQKQKVGTLFGVSVNGVNRIYSFRRLKDYPLYVLVSYDMADVLRNYEAAKRHAGVTGLLATIAGLLLGGLWIKWRFQGTAAKRALKITLESMSQGIVMFDDKGRVPVVNKRALEMLKLPQAAARDPSRLKLDALMLPPPDGAVPPDGPASFDTTDGDGRIIEVIRSTTPDGGQVMTYTDVTDRNLALIHVRHLAEHDTLTGLANRLVLNDRLKSAIETAARQRRGLAVFCLDLDKFKNVNDTMGHEVGDQLLVSAAERLRSLLRPSDIIARMGGDEFTIVQIDGIQPAAARNLAERLIEAFSQPLHIEDRQYTISTSIGIACYPDDGLDARTMMRMADTALYRAKGDGRATFRFFEPWMDSFLQERRLLEQDLHAAVERDELEVYLQPQFSCDTLRVSSFEALLRWNHPVRGFVPASTFIPIAEESGLIDRIGRFILERACTVAASLNPRTRVAVNVSPAQFRDGTLPDQVAAILRATGLPAGYLEIEVTEGLLITNEAQALSVLQKLKSMGVHVALDDFGTGYSSLSYLRRFPFDRVKIDKSFIQAQLNDAGTRAIVETVLEMCQRLNLAVTAEGIETEEQLRALQRQGCTDVQGFLLGRPVPAAEAAAMLRAGPAPFAGRTVVTYPEMAINDAAD